MSKDRKQILMLSAMLLVIVGVLLYVYKDSLLPQGSGEGVAPTARIRIPEVSDKDQFFDRQDYKDLRGTAGVPVQPIQVDTKGVNPFATQQ